MEMPKIPDEFVKWLFKQKEPFAIFYNSYYIELVSGSMPFDVWRWYIKEYGEPEPEEEEIKIETREDYIKFIEENKEE